MHVLTVTHRSPPAPAKLSYVRILNEGKVNPLINHPHVGSMYLISRGDVLFLCNCSYIPSVCMDNAHNTLKIHTTWTDSNRTITTDMYNVTKLCHWCDPLLLGLQQTPFQVRMNNTGRHEHIRASPPLIHLLPELVSAPCIAFIFKSTYIHWLNKSILRLELS